MPLVEHGRALAATSQSVILDCSGLLVHILAAVSCQATRADGSRLHQREAESRRAPQHWDPILLLCTPVAVRPLVLGFLGSSASCIAHAVMN